MASLRGKLFVGEAEGRRSKSSLEAPGTISVIRKAWTDEGEKGVKGHYNTTAKSRSANQRNEREILNGKTGVHVSREVKNAKSLSPCSDGLLSFGSREGELEQARTR